MRTIGILGGMSWQSYADYHSVLTLVLSVDFAEIAALQPADD